MYKKFVNIYGKIIKHIKLRIIWWSRIFMAPNHFKVPFFIRIKYNIFGGYMADQYALYDLKHHKNEYLSEYDWYKSRYINMPYNFILNNKIVSTKLLEPYIKVPKIFIFKEKKLVKYDGGIVKYSDIISLIKEEKKVYLKPISEGKGKGVILLSYDHNKFYVDMKETSSKEIEDTLRKRDNWFISKAIEQSDFLNNIYNETPNTMRIITWKNAETNQFDIHFAVLRIGTSSTIPVDNGSRGGLVSKVDLETGSLSEARNLHSLNVWTTHPDSKTIIKDQKIPNWKEIKKDIINLSNQFPFLKFIAWDVLLTNEGPVIIEANTSSGVNIIQLWGPQLNGPLGNFYREQGIVKRKKENK